MAENASPSFSTSHASTKSTKRRSLDIIISPGPRPLHLASGSVLSSPAHSPALYSPNANSPAVGTSSHHRIGPPPLVGASTVKNGHRQSSISYIPSNRDKGKPLTLPSPLSPTGFSRGIPLTRRNSAVPTSPGVVELVEEEGLRVASAVTMDTVKQLKGRPPTLAEKHADLLHFIAQKESKCLELRSQLATHEAELLQLKRKWERIVNRGFEKASSISFSSPSIPSSSARAHVPYLYAPPLTTTPTGGSSGVMFEGIKEGVQGMGRLITAGLGSIAHVGVTEGNTFTSSSTTGTLPPASIGNRRKSSTFPVPLRLHSGNGHESHSSSSTSASITTAPSSSSTSATSLEHSTTQTLSPPFTSTSHEVLSGFDEFGDFEEAPPRRNLVINEEEQEEENPVQVLMVHDTGATPTMSPNPHFQRRKSRMKVGQKEPNSSGLLDTGWGEDDGWMRSRSRVLPIEVDDNVVNCGSQATAATAAVSFSSHTTIQPVPTNPPKTKTPSLPGVSSIPGLASSSISMNGTTPQLMNAWVDSVGKKWGEIRESQTFTKSQKRASILLSDVSQSIVSALISPPPPSTTVSTPSARSVSKPSSPTNPSCAMNASSHVPQSQISPLAQYSPSNKNTIVIPPSSSLLDDDVDIGEVDEAFKNLGMVLSPVLIPDSSTTTTKNLGNPNTMKLKVIASTMDNNNMSGGAPSSSSIDDEDWNW